MPRRQTYQEPPYLTVHTLMEFFAQKLCMSGDVSAGDKANIVAELISCLAPRQKLSGCGFSCDFFHPLYAFPTV